MKLVSERPRISTRELADKVGISNGAAYYVIKALVEKGFVKLENFHSSPQKGRYAYFLTPKGLLEKSVLTKKFIERKRKEFELLKTEISALEKDLKETAELKVNGGS